LDLFALFRVIHAEKELYGEMHEKGRKTAVAENLGSSVAQKIPPRLPAV